METYEQVHILKTQIRHYVEAFALITGQEWTEKPDPFKWSKLEILGHLIDSAQNNLRRFIVTQYQENQSITYDQNQWVAIQAYQTADPAEIIALWQGLNLQIARVWQHTPDQKWSALCNHGELVTLAFLKDDYLLHMQHHLDQIIIR